jgi:surface protein
MKKSFLLLMMILLVPICSWAENQGYAEFDEVTGTLTFKYGEKPSGAYPLGGWSAVRKDIKKVIFDSSFAEARPTSTKGWFSGANTLTEIVDIQYLNTSNVENMYFMFSGCKGLTSLDVSHFNTSNVTDMSYMFSGCSGLTSLDVSNFDTRNVINMPAMFSSCKGLTSLNLGHFDTSNVTDVSFMFHNCIGLISLDLSNFNTSNVTDMSFMFDNCSGLISLDLSNFNTGNVTDMSDMFSGCIGLTNLDIGNFNTRNVTNMSRMFYVCSSLTSLDLSSFDTSNVTDMSSMFNICSSLTSLDLSSFDTSNVTDMSSMFNICSSLTSLDLSNFYTSNLTNIEGMFAGCRGLTNLDLSHFDTSKLTNMSYMFNACSSLTTLDLSSFDTSNVTDMSYMFNACSSLISLNISNFNTTNVITMEGMFYDCSSLTSLNLSNYSNNNVTTMKSLFYNCSSLTSLNLSNFNTSNVTDFSSMFYGCSSLTSLDVSNFDTRKVTSMGGMFYSCSGLTNLDISSFNTSNVTNIVYMFAGCQELISLNLGNFVTTKATEKNDIFNNCNKITEVYCQSEVVPIIDETEFSGIDNATLHVPTGKINAYKAVSPWNKFKNIWGPKFNLVYKVDGEEYKKYEWEEGREITPEEAPTKEGYTFSGWSEIPEIMPAQDVTIMGTFTENTACEVNGIYYNLLDDNKAEVTYHPGSVIVDVAGNATRESSYYSGNITIPSSINYEGVEYSVVGLGDYAFVWCADLLSISLPEGLEYIGKEALSCCENMTSITLPESLLSIGDRSFWYCIKLESLVIPDNVTTIGWRAFGGCEKMLSIVIGKSVQDISSDYWTNAIETVTFKCPEVKRWVIGNNVKEVYFSDEVNTIDDNAFIDYNNLTTITLGKGIGQIGKNAFNNRIETINCYAETIPNADEFSFSSYSTTILRVPIISLEQYKETSPWSLFTNVFSLTDEYYLTYMVDGEEYKSLLIKKDTSIVPEEAPTKEGYTFSGWGDIPETMPEQNVTINGTFTINKYMLTYQVDGESYKEYEIEYGAEITPEGEPTKVGYTFSGWSDIPETMPANDVTVTGTFTVKKYKLTYIIDGYTYKEYEIEYGSSITPEAEPTWDGYTFSGWSEIPETMPAHDVTVTGTFTQVEYRVDDITYEISGEGTVTVKGGEQTGEITIEGTVIINGQTYQVTAIADNAFKDNQKITSLTISEGITEIGENAFSGCIGLIIINIGKDVQTIGNRAFANVGSVGTRTRSDEVSLIVNCYTESVPQTAPDAFENTPIETGALYVVDNLKDAYKVTSPWNKFGKIFGFNEPAGINAITSDSGNAFIFDMQGNRLDNVRKGVNIIRARDGKTKKVMMK